MQKILGKKKQCNEKHNSHGYDYVLDVVKKKKYDMGGKNNKSFAFSHNSSRECKHLIREQKASTYYFSSHIIFSFFTMSL